MNSQAAQAGEKADALIKQLATPGEAIEATDTSVEVLDQAQPVQPTAPENDWEKRFKGYRSSTDKTLHTLRR